MAFVSQLQKILPAPVKKESSQESKSSELPTSSGNNGNNELDRAGVAHSSPSLKPSSPGKQSKESPWKATSRRRPSVLEEEHDTSMDQKLLDMLQSDFAKSRNISVNKLAAPVSAAQDAVTAAAPAPNTKKKSDAKKKAKKSKKVPSYLGLFPLYYAGQVAKFILLTVLVTFKQLICHSLAVMKLVSWPWPCLSQWSSSGANFLPAFSLYFSQLLSTSPCCSLS